MNKQALIISNPGPEDSDDFLEGVEKDVARYRDFLMSPFGGLWAPDEIRRMVRPSVSRLRRFVRDVSGCDYALVIFAGHGYYSGDEDATILILNEDDEIDSDELGSIAEKQTMILDCCRKKSRPVPPMIIESMRFAKRRPVRNPQLSRAYYEQDIKAASDGLVTLFACGIDEYSREHANTGGYYSYSLLATSNAWASNLPVSRSGEYESRSVVGAHKAAVPLVKKWSRAKQNPTIDRARTGPYYPFCIVA
jgi:hypothetical protein